MKQADVASLRMLRRARDRIDRDYAEQIDIPALAAGAGYSREHGIEALLRDDSGNWFSFCQHKFLEGRA